MQPLAFKFQTKLVKSIQDVQKNVDLHSNASNEYCSCIRNLKRNLVWQESVPKESVATDSMSEQTTKPEKPPYYSVQS